MQNTLKPILSIVAMALFVLMAAACFGPDIATNTRVPVKDCETKATAFGYLKIHIKVNNVYGTPGVAYGNIFITHQKVKPDSCVAVVEKYSTLNFTTDINGEYTYTEETQFAHNNKQDLFRIEVITNGLLSGAFASDTKVITYNQAVCSFELTLPPIIYKP